MSAKAPPPPSPFPLNRAIREGDAKPLPPDDAPCPGQSRYRLARRGPYYRVEEYRRRGWWLWARAEWRPVGLPMIERWAREYLKELRDREQLEAEGWIPEPEEQP